MSPAAKIGCVSSCVLALCMTNRALAQDSFFIGLGALPSTALPSGAIGVSGDGSVVVGASRRINSSSADWAAFQWTRPSGLMSLGELPGGQNSSVPYAVSADGSTIVGEGNSPVGREPFRWTQSSGMIGLGGLPGQPVNGFARAVSANGDVVVGETRLGSSTTAFRWTNAGGMVSIGDLPGGSLYSAAYGCTADGNTIVGYSRSANGLEAFRWRADTGMIGLGDLPGGIFLSSATAVTPSGNYIVGDSSSVNGTAGNRIEAYIWNEQTGMIGLGDLPGGQFESSAFDVSADGTTVVGASAVDDGYQAFIWRPDNGMRNLTDALTTDYGLSLPGWRLTIARSISEDGRTIVGEGVNPDGLTEAWVAHIPEPSSAALLMAGLLIPLVRRMRL